MLVALFSTHQTEKSLAEMPSVCLVHVFNIVYLVGGFRRACRKQAWFEMLVKLAKKGLPQSFDSVASNELFKRYV